MTSTIEACDARLWITFGLDELFFSNAMSGSQIDDEQGALFEGGV